MLHPYLSTLSILIVLCIRQMWAERFDCQEDEFLCPVDYRCIPKSKLCNFVDDCLGGADEMHCGSCDFSLQKPEECGLILKADKAFSWFLREPLQEELSESVIFHGNDPLYYIETNLNSTMKQYIHRHHDRLHATHKPRILFPHLRPTNNDKCQANVRMRITELNGIEAQLADVMEDTSWPQVKLLLIEPKEHLDSVNNSTIIQKGRENRKYTSVDFEVKKVSASKRGNWLNYAIPLGAHRTVWTLELMVEARLKSFLVQISSIKYDDCAPIDSVEYIDEAHTDAPLDNICDSGQFKCELSGLCISRLLICDFGHDCGENDNSDEEYCDDYLGRCDFEDETLCDWILPEDKSWLRVSAAEEDQPFYGSKLARPVTDHTFQSSALGGNYLLLNATQLRTFTMYNLIGPHVSRHPEATECSLRFWASTPSSLISSNVRYPHLNVGRVHIPADLLFLDGTHTWHRHEVRLLSRSNIEESNIFSLLVGFGNFGSDLEKFLNAGGYLALDDFSFTPGCHLVFHGPSLEDYTCSDDEFFCRIATPVTGAHCIPLQYYCDFKNDCGLDDTLDFTAEDERDCSSECSLQSNRHCLAGLEIRDGVSKKLNNAYKVSDQINEAFNWSLRLEATSGELKIQAKSETFINNYKAEIAAHRGADKQVKVIRNLRNLEIHLPSFSESHGNCSFELTYKWAEHTDNAIRAAIYLTNESRLTRHKLGKLIPDDGSRTRLQTAGIGIGQQQIPFRLMLDVYYADNLVNMRAYDGALSIYSYRFLDCAFPSGLLQVEKEVEFEKAEDDLDDDDMGAMEYLDYQYTSSVNTTCEPDYFQCFDPVLCISEDLVCDMQRDCQGGRDEHGCSKWLQYNFDHLKSNGSSHLAWSDGWHNEPGAELLWSPSNGMTSARESFNTGPPYDHTHSDYTGQYLATWGKPGQFNATQTACLVSPPFTTGPLCKRIVFYLYYWGEHVNTFQVFRRQVSGEEKLLYELKGDKSREQSVDRWQRISLPLISADNFDQVEIVFRATSGSGPADLIALDDISLGPLCGLSSGASSDQQTTASTSGDQHEENQSQHHHHWTKVAVVLAIVTALLVFVSVRYQSRRMLDIVSSLGLKESSASNRDLTTSGLMMELSLETLCSEQYSASNQSSSINQLYESQNHQL